MDIYFQMAPLEIKRKMLGSIFPGKLIYQDGKYRTEGMNSALELILQKTSGLQKEKTGNIVISENIFGNVPTQDSFRTFKEFDWRSIDQGMLALA